MQTITPPPRFVNVPSILLYGEDLDPRVLRTLLRIYGMHWDTRIRPRLKARDWQKVAGLTRSTFHRHIQELQSSGWLLFSRDDKGVLSFEFDQKVSHGWDSNPTDGMSPLTLINSLDLTIKDKDHSNATVPPMGKGKKKPRDPNLDHPAVKMYRQVMHLTANHVQRELIVRVVKNLELWQDTLEHWAGHGWRPTNVQAIMDSYNYGGSVGCRYCQEAKIKYAKKRRKPVPKTDQVSTPVSPAVLRKMVERARREQGLSDEDVYG